MKRKQSTEEQIITILKEAEAGAKVGDLIRRHGIAEGTYYRWKAKYGGMDVSEQQERQMLKRRIRADGQGEGAGNALRRSHRQTQNHRRAAVGHPVVEA